MTNTLSKGIPDKTRMQIIFYWETDDIDGLNAFAVAANSQQYYQFRGNAPFDPDTSVGGTTAQWWNIYNKIYQSITCFGSKFSAYIYRADVNAATNALPCELFVGLIPMDDSLGTSDWPQSYFAWETTKNAKTKRIISNQGIGKNRWKISQTMFTTKLYGRKIDPSLDMTTVNSLPSQAWNYNLVFVNRSTTNFNGKLRIFVKYWVEFSEPVTNFDEWL